MALIMHLMRNSFPADSKIHEHVPSDRRGSSDCGHHNHAQGNRFQPTDSRLLERGGAQPADQEAEASFFPNLRDL